MSALVLVDGDPIVYRCGFAAQRKLTRVIAEGAVGTITRWKFENKTDYNNWKASHADFDVLDEHEEIEVEPLPFVLQTVKQVLSVIKALGPAKIYLTATGEEAKNFRNELATIVPYKGNRANTPRPVHYEAIREYLITQHGAQVINGREADDELSIQAARLRKSGSKYIVASTDKDLDQIPGHHYDYARHVDYTVGELYAEKWFWQQVLSGDPTDNIPGCWKVGKGKAAALVDEWYLEKCSPHTIWQRVVAQYHKSREKAGCPYADKEPEAVALETARLVYMQKEPGELWNPPGTPHGRIEGDKDD